jgi:hypothetical protein
MAAGTRFVHNVTPDAAERDTGIGGVRILLVDCARRLVLRGYWSSGNILPLERSTIVAGGFNYVPRGGDGSGYLNEV